MNWERKFSKRTALMRRSAVRELLKLTDQPGMISFAGGVPAPELFPLEEIARASGSVLAHHGAAALQYGPTEGLTELRDRLAAQFSRPNRPLTRSNVVITCGGQQALDLLGRVLLDENDLVIVENPTYLAALMAWRPLGVRFAPLLGDANGLQTEQLDGWRDQLPKMLYTVPNFQNPQGTTLSFERRQHLARWTREHNVCLVEDNPYGELRFEGQSLPHLWDLAHPEDDASCNTVYVGTFSKVLAPGLRIGWLLGDEAVMDKVVRAKQAADLHTCSLSQHIVLELLKTGCVERQLPRLRAAYAERRDAMAATLRIESSLSFTLPQGGMFLLVKLPDKMDGAALLSEAIKRGVAFVPGEEFHLGGAGKNTIRLSYSNATPEMIGVGVARLLAALRSFP